MLLSLLRSSRAICFPSSHAGYAPPVVIGVTQVIVNGSPNKANISTSFVERPNLTIRMMCRRLTRLTNAFSKKLENLKEAMALHFANYNFCRIHATLRIPRWQQGLRLMFGA